MASLRGEPAAGLLASVRCAGAGTRLARGLVRAALGTAIVVSACNGGTGGNSTEPLWVVQHTPHSSLAIVYVHGIFGDTLGTWTHDGGARFFDLVNTVPGIAGKADVYAFGFPSNMFQSGSFDIREAANRLHLRLDGAGVLGYPRIVFVAHSMGGLVVLRELLTNPHVRDRVPVLVFFGTPQEGADITRIAQNVANNPALSQMTPADHNDLLKTLSDEWNSIPAARRPRIRCAYEKLPTFGVMIVPWSSATRFCEGAPPAIAADHIGMVKADRADRDAVLVVTSALKEYVFSAALETPDFRKEGDEVVVDLASAVGRQKARLVNSGGASLRFTLAEISDPLLYLWPDDTPKELPPGDMDMFMALGMGARATRYQFVLRTDVSPDTRVTVRVPNLAQLQAQQVRLVEDVAGGIERMLADPETGPRLRAAAANDLEAPAAMVRAARASVARTSPELPESAQWVLAAEALHATNWPGLSVVALREAEKASPAVARTPGVQRLAAATGALSGETRVLQTVPTPELSPAQVAQLGESNLLVGAGVDRARRLAGRLQQAPALKVFGLSLEGDAQKASGNTEAARRSFEAAATIRATPSVNRRIGTVSKVPARGGVTPPP